MKALLFDLDGTLLDTSKGIGASLQYTLKQLGLKTIPDNELQRFIGPPIQLSLAESYGLSKEEADAGAAIFRRHYSEESLLFANYYDGIEDTLTKLKARGVMMGVATYKREDYALKLLQHFGVERFCPVMHGADAAGKMTKADIVDMCIREMGVEREETVLVGDTDHDAKGAANAGIGFIAVTWGFGYHKASDIQDYPCRAIIDHPSQLLDII